MLTVLPYLIGLNLAAVLVILFTGLGSMTQGTGRRSNTLMRWRVGLQASCVALFLLYVALMRLG
ncbi:MAG: twin transmembrane helix small protein [Alphaproteobacteria bacterium]|nr:twin transmembrane helix small protein [Alphaproteobacteria bacterium]